MCRQLAFRHMERAEQHIPKRKQRAEIGVAGFVRPRVVPAVEYGRLAPKQSRVQAAGSGLLRGAKRRSQ
jgi:hypothetical protein